MPTGLTSDVFRYANNRSVQVSPAKPVTLKIGSAVESVTVSLPPRLDRRINLPLRECTLGGQRHGHDLDLSMQLADQDNRAARRSVRLADASTYGLSARYTVLGNQKCQSQQSENHGAQSREEPTRSRYPYQQRQNR